MKGFFCLVLLLSYCVSSAQTEKSLYVLVNRGNSIVHTENVKFLSGSTSEGFELRYSFRKTDSNHYKKFSGFLTRGISLGYTKYSTNIVDKGVYASFFVSPRIKVSKSINLNLNLDLGLIYLNNPFDSTLNPLNRSYSTKISYYFGVGAMAHININPKLQVILGSSFRHASNGGVRRPNAGINWTTNNIGLQYNFTAQQNVKPLKKIYNLATFKKTTFWELSIISSAYDLNHERRVYLGLIGIQLQKNWQFARANIFNIGSEVFIDNAFRRLIQREADRKIIGFRSGITVGHTFIFSKIKFSQQIGYHLTNQFKQYPNFYQRITLTHKLSKKLAIGISYLIHEAEVNFYDGRLVFRL